MINSAEDARSVVSLAKFPPRGLRGQGGPFACFAHGIATPAEYVNQANENLLTMVQIETAAGVQNIDEICRVDGIGGRWSLVPASSVATLIMGLCRSRPHRPERPCSCPVGLHAGEMDGACISQCH